MTDHLQIPKGTRFYWYRRRVPDALRNHLGRTEIRFSLGTTSRSEARALAAERTVALDREWDDLRHALRSGRLQPARVRKILTSEQIDEVVADVFWRWVNHHVERETPVETLREHRRGDFDLRYDPITEHGQNEVEDESILVQPHGFRVTRFTPARAIMALPTLRASMKQFGCDLYDVDRDQQLMLRQQAARAIMRAEDAIIRSLTEEVDIDAGPDAPPRPLHLAPRPKLSLSDWFERHAATVSSSTARRWRPVQSHLAEHLRHNDATLLTSSDVRSWRDALLDAGKSAKTVQDVYLAALKAVLNLAVAEGVLETNVAGDVKVRARPKPVVREKGFSDDEANLILGATLIAENSVHLAIEHARARRWVPWLCAYSGARVNEITQLRTQDVARVDGHWVIRITPEAGSVKNHQSRTVPIHPDLIEQGFIELVDALPSGPIFYDPDRGRGSERSGSLYKKVGERLAAWVRKNGLRDPNVAPNHGWRHRFRTRARRYGLAQDVTDYLCGHAPGNQGASYGSFDVAVLFSAIAALPVELPDRDRPRFGVSSTEKSCGQQARR